MRWKGLIMGAAVLVGCAALRNGYATPPYTIVESESDLELRSYPGGRLAVVSTPAEESGFRTLFRYISGENASGEKIPMTVPVRMRQDSALKETAFFLPPDADPAGIPAPTDKNIRIEPLAPGLYAALRFSGRARLTEIAEPAERLRAWCRARGHQPVGPIYLDQYDPPWTLWFLRKNELVIRVAPES